MLWLPWGAVVIIWLQQLLHCDVQLGAVQERHELCELPSGALSSYKCAHVHKLRGLSLGAVPVLHWAQHMHWLPRGAVVIIWLQQLLHCEVQRWSVQE